MGRTDVIRSFVLDEIIYPVMSNAFVLVGFSTALIKIFSLEFPSVKIEVLAGSIGVRASISGNTTGAYDTRQAVIGWWV